MFRGNGKTRQRKRRSEKESLIGDGLCSDKLLEFLYRCSDTSVLICFAGTDRFFIISILSETFSDQFMCVCADKKLAFCNREAVVFTVLLRNPGKKCLFLFFIRTF